MKVTFKRVVLPALLALTMVGCTTSASSGANTTSTKPTNEVASTETAITKVSVNIAPGTLVGYNYKGVNTFRGVPYATAERFKNPVPIEKYENGEQMALTFGEVSPQGIDQNSATRNSAEFMTPSNGTADMITNENCQFLNVWSSDLSAKKPVVVFFHGGGLTGGASSELSYYTGDNFAASQDAVFVSVNHRLNVLGFLDLSTYDDAYADSGLVGMEDCITALQWVQDNISSFGGDPSNVTIIGQSGGGQKVTTLACMADSEGLFDKVVVWSGGWSTEAANAEAAAANTKLLVDQLQLSDDKVIDTLTTMPYDELITAATAAKCQWSTNYGLGTFDAPLFDADGNMNEHAKKRSWIVGSTYSEFSANGQPMTKSGSTVGVLETSDEDAKEAIKAIYGDATDEAIKLFQEAYPEKKLAELPYLNTMRGDSGLSRINIIDPNTGILKKMNDAGVTVYNYVSAYTEPYFGGITMHHTGDIPYWFDNLDKIDYQVIGDTANAQKAANAMSSALAAFMATGNPSTDTLTWDPYTSDAHNTMVFDEESEQRTDFDKKLYDLVLENDIPPAFY